LADKGEVGNNTELVRLDNQSINHEEVAGRWSELVLGVQLVPATCSFELGDRLRLNDMWYV